MEQVRHVRNAGSPTSDLTTDGVKAYYDQMTATYVAGFGEVFQGSRPESTEELLNYILDSADVRDGMRILDAGCGVCGPAIWFAEHRNITVDALTISPKQVAAGERRVEEHSLSRKITVREGDFHRLSEIYPKASFDRVLFLETLCHAEDYRLVLEEVKKVLKPGGFLYIKDFYCLDFRSRPEYAETLAKDLEKLNRVYRLVLPDLPSMLDLVLELGFQFRFAREPNYVSSAKEWLRFEQLSPQPWAPKIFHAISGVEVFCRLPVPDEEIFPV